MKKTCTYKKAAVMKRAILALVVGGLLAWALVGSSGLVVFQFAAASANCEIVWGWGNP